MRSATPRSPGLTARQRAASRRTLARARAALARTRTRRIARAALLGLAAALLCWRITAPPGATILVATRPLEAGARVVAADFQTVTNPHPPDGALTAVPADARLDGPLARGEPLTRTRLLDSRLPSGHVVMPVTLCGGSGWVRPGDRLLLFPGASDAPYADPVSTERKMLDDAVADRNQNVIGPVRVFNIYAAREGASFGAEAGGSPPVLVALERDDAPRLADAVALGSLCAALMP